MRMTRILLMAASVFVAGCASDGTTGGNAITNPTTQLVAVVQPPPTPRLGEATVTFNVVVTSNLQETVSGGVCAERVEAKPISSGSWTDVTASSLVCTRIAAILEPGGTLNLAATADRAKLAALLSGNANSVLMRVRHSLAGMRTSQNYQVLSNEITVTVN